jgi:hypothetical protein
MSFSSKTLAAAACCVAIAYAFGWSRPEVTHAQTWATPTATVEAIQGSTDDALSGNWSWRQWPTTVDF